MKKFILSVFVSGLSLSLLAQYDRSSAKETRQQEKRERISAAIKQEEEGNLSYTTQNSFGVQLRTNGYGIFYELGKRRSQRFTNIYNIELTENKHAKEEKVSTGNFFSNSFVYGKVNNFYQLKLGFGQQYIFGQKGNKNGIAVIGYGQAGLSLGLLKPYYLEVRGNGQTSRTIRFSDDSTAFMSYNNIIGGAGIGKGFGEIKVKPGVYVKTGLRFDFGRYNETVSAIEIGLSVEGYGSKIEQMAYADQKRLFFQGHLAFVFGKRK